jgi:hypothetical protein
MAKTPTRGKSATAASTKRAPAKKSTAKVAEPTLLEKLRAVRVSVDELNRDADRLLKTLI